MNNPHAATRRALFFYGLLWIIMAPILRFHKRMKIGYDQRILKRILPRADLWIQAASVGEAYLVEELLMTLAPQTPLTILVTTNTSQGLAILKKIKPATSNISLELRYCPFDRPTTMDRAVRMVQPRLVVLIETELWPGFLYACKAHDVPVCVINGRMTEKSMKGYLRMPQMWQDLAPASILAMSEADGQRFATVFAGQRTTIIPNIKFDRILRTSAKAAPDSQLAAILAPDTPFVILGSTRSEEEEDIRYMIEALLHHNPKVVIGLFPRHMERISAWQQLLSKLQVPFQLRSEISAPVSEGTVILWDTMGELQQGFHRANAAFIGGSLAPLGGQNFMEPLSTGVRPVIGNSWSNFYWVGEDIFHQNLVIKVNNSQEAVDALLYELQHPKDRTAIQEEFIKYARNHQGGTAMACDEITRHRHQ